mgnify:CR=1 FL=1
MSAQRLENIEREKVTRRPKLAQYKATLEKLWQALKSSPEEQVLILAELLDHAEYSPELAAR